MKIPNVARSSELYQSHEARAVETGALQPDEATKLRRWVREGHAQVADFGVAGIAVFRWAPDVFFLDLIIGKPGLILGPVDGLSFLLNQIGAREIRAIGRRPGMKRILKIRKFKPMAGGPDWYHRVEENRQWVD